MDNFGEILKEKRRECNIRQGELAEKIGVHPQTVSKWERGKMLPDFLARKYRGLYSVLQI